MAKYDVTVDTRDMANKIDTVSNKVSGVTTAVVAMEAAVIAAERDATNKLCKRLNKGFFSLVTSQIEQKNATALSSVNAYASELIQQQEALLDLKKRMGDDFVILTERYSKLFRGLDVALHNRVHELDKPVIRFCEWDVAITLNRLNNLIGTVPVNQTESLATTQAIAAAHIKRNAQALIAQMTIFLTTCKQQSAKMQRIKLNSFVGKSVLRYLPAIILVKKEDRGEVVETKLPSGLEQLIGQRSCTKIRENMERTVEGSGWENVSIESQRMVAGKLERLIATSDLNERVKENMKKLMARNETWLNVKEG